MDLRNSRFIVRAMHLAIGGGMLLVMLHFYLPGRLLLIPGSFEREKELEERQRKEGRVCSMCKDCMPGEYVQGDDVLRGVDSVALASVYWFILLCAIKLRARLKKPSVLRKI